MTKNKKTSPAAKAGDFDGALRAGSHRYEDFDPRGAFIGRRDLTEEQWPEYKAAYENGYRAMLKQYGRGSK